MRAPGRATLLGFVLSTIVTTAAALTINLTYDPDSTFLNAGLSSADIANMKAAASYAASQFTNNLNDGVNVNIKVTAVPGTGTLGGSSTFLTSVSSYAALRSSVAGDAKTADDATALSAGGSLPTSDPIIRPLRRHHPLPLPGTRRQLFLRLFGRDLLPVRI